MYFFLYFICGGEDNEGDCHVLSSVFDWWDYLGRCLVIVDRGASWCLCGLLLGCGVKVFTQ